MFAESMLETSWAQRGRRGWTTLTSFGVQAVAIGIALMIPVLQTVGLPTGHVLSTPVSLGGPPPAAPPIHRQQSTTLPQSNLVDNILVAPPSIPRVVRIIDETELPPQVSYNNGPGVVGSTGDGSGEGVWKSINDSLSHVVARPVPALAPAIRQFRTSTMLQGSLIRRVEPVYPTLARSARIQGSVVLAAVISKEGTMENLRLLSGHPMLVPAAIQAVSQWRYKPYILNDEAIEVETQITVNFILAGN
jgi:periplasmic protein TonB